MFRPSGDYIVIETYRDLSSGIVTPETAKGDTFLVKDVGAGWYTTAGVLVPHEIKVGDRVAIQGKILNVPYQGSVVMVTSFTNIILIETSDIPDAI